LYGTGDVGVNWNPVNWAKCTCSVGVLIEPTTKCQNIT